MDTDGLTKRQIKRLQSMIRGLQRFPPIFGVYGDAWFALKAVIMKRDHGLFYYEPDYHAFHPLVEYAPNGERIRNYTDGDVIDLAWNTAKAHGNTEIQFTYIRRVWYHEEKEWVDEPQDMCDSDIGFPANSVSVKFSDWG